MKIKISTLVEWQLYIVMVIEMLISLFHIPSAARYLLDVNMLLLISISLVLILSSALKKRVTTRIYNDYVVIKHYIIIYMCLFVSIAIFTNVPFGQILWAVRNNYFFIFYFFICVMYLSKSDCDRIMKRFVNLQIVNVVAAAFEYFVLHARNDYLGGMFGTSQGCNGYLNVYLVIICAYVLTQYLNGKASLIRVLLIFGSSLLLAAISELKIFYIELIVIIIFAVLLNANMVKGIIAIAVGAFGLIIGLNILSSINPQSMEYLSSFDALFEYGSRSDFGYGDVRIARLTAITQINNMFFGDNFWNKLFGYGLGACEESATFSFCNSSFADRYGSLGYRNITSSMNYLETGMIGLVMFLFIFVLIFVIIQMSKKRLRENEYIGTFVQVIAVLTIFICFYNSTIRREIAYMTFFVFAYYFICLKESANGDKKI